MKIYIQCVLLYVQDANERLKPVPSIPGDRETLLRLLDRCQQEIDRLTGELCTDYYCVLLRPLGVLLCTCSVSLSCTDEWRNMLNKLEMANAEKSSTQSKLDEIMLQDSSAKVCTFVCIYACAYVCVYVCVGVTVCMCLCFCMCMCVC